ncbi:hypothetical protein C9374_008235 [Naegleria lovaniensis]|uniref:Uncharacterized protein n=1 Tax=Naegleria lovaniensis TaxID=51637 RepID=A0AA88KHV7_NAELO|nr:uncharacterized protein C9374_008235 [Naegleria lovaniensis]KAG2378596.1 hypothetical protein C9374_008235 [Naegleria lovaniensis]
MASSFETTPQLTYSLSSIADLLNQHTECSNIQQQQEIIISSSSPLLVKPYRHSFVGSTTTSKHHDASNHSLFPFINGLSDLLKEDPQPHHSNNPLHDANDPKSHPFELLPSPIMIPQPQVVNPGSTSTFPTTKTPSPKEGSLSKDLAQHHTSTTIDCGVALDSGDGHVKSSSTTSNQQVAAVQAPQQTSLDFVSAYAIFLQNQQRQQQQQQITQTSSNSFQISTSQTSDSTGILDVLSGSTLTNPNAYILLQQHNRPLIGNGQTNMTTNVPNRSTSPSSQLSSVPTTTTNSVSSTSEGPSTKRKRNASKESSSKKPKTKMEKKERKKQTSATNKSESSSLNSHSFYHQQQQYAIACGNIWFVPNEFDVFKSGKKRQGVQYKFENMITPSNYKGVPHERRD